MSLQGQPGLCKATPRSTKSVQGWSKVSKVSPRSVWSAKDSKVSKKDNNANPMSAPSQSKVSQRSAKSIKGQQFQPKVNARSGKVNKGKLLSQFQQLNWQTNQWTKGPTSSPIELLRAAKKHPVEGWEHSALNFYWSNIILCNFVVWCRKLI